MSRRLFVIVFGASLSVAAAVAVVVASRNRQQPAPPDVPVAASPAEVRVKAVERKTESVERENVTASGAIAIVCGEDKATADRYEARNDALRSIARRWNLPKNDVDALLVYLRRADDAMRVERVAALKNDVMNLLRNQDPPAEGLAETLMGMFEGNSSTHNSPTHPHPPAVLDYCIQHLGAMVNELDDAMCNRVREVLVREAREKTKPCAGTALYSLAKDKRASLSQKNELKRLTLALCKQGSHSVARISAIQLAGERGYKEILPILRETLSSPRRDAVLDIVCIGSLGLLGDESDLKLLSQFSSDTRRSVAVKAAIKRIKERASK